MTILPRRRVFPWSEWCEFWSTEGAAWLSRGWLRESDLESVGAPALTEQPPSVQIDIVDSEAALSSAAATATAKIRYGSPAHFEVDADDRLRFVSEKKTGTISRRDRAAEHVLRQGLRQKSHLAPWQPVRLEGDALHRLTREWEGAAKHASVQVLDPRAEFDAQTGTWSFHAGDVPESVILDAVQSGEGVAYYRGGYFSVPKSWATEHGELALFYVREREDKKARQERPSKAWDLRLSENRADLRNRPEVRPITDPAPFLREVLRDYQQAGADWLYQMSSGGVGALLADEMGLGKTLQTLALPHVRTLVLAPKSVVPVWRREIEKFRPDLQLDREITVVSHGRLRVDPVLRDSDWDLVVMDEAQTLRNPETLLFAAANVLRSRARIALSGTPIENRLRDLHTLMHWLNPRVCGSWAEFSELPLDRALARARPFMLRRTKTQVLPSLPPLSEVVLPVELDDRERTTYAAALAQFSNKAADVPSILAAITRLRQLAYDPRLVRDDPALGPSSKLRALTRLLAERIASGQASLVFSQWTSLLDLVEQELKRAGIEWVRLDGSTRDRDAAVQRFQAPSGPPVFLISLMAGGTGLTATRAQNVFLLDPWWNPQVEAQAVARAHRIGTEHPVMLTRLVAEGTVEERIVELQYAKRELFSRLGGATEAGITRDELLSIFEPPTDR